MVRILGIETSCDETAIGIVQDGRKILSSVLASSQQFHSKYGGVVPEIAARVHVEVIWQVLEQALEQADCKLTDIDAIAVTRGPGLPGALLIGLSFAKGLALATDRPLLGIDHLAAHLYAGQMTEQAPEPPYIGLIVSGGHTMLCVTHADFRYELLGETKDDAAGEAFDKVAKMLGLGYPGGPVIDQISSEGNRQSIQFPRSSARDGYDFSFSGLKTSVYQYVNKSIRELEEKKEAFDRNRIADVAASFQEATVDILLAKTFKACQRTGIKQLVVGGGVASNSRLRKRVSEEASAKGINVTIPAPSLCVDNGAMVAGLAFGLLRKGSVSDLSLSIDPNLCLEQ